VEDLKLYTPYLVVFILYTISHCNACIHVLDDQEVSVDAGGFGDGFHEGIVPLLEVAYLEYIPGINSLRFVEPPTDYFLALARIASIGYTRPSAPT